MKKLCVFGGRFDPPHMAHMIHARLVLEMFELDKVLFVPAANPPHREVYASFSDRAEMLRLAIEDEASFEVSNIEWKEDLSYTVDTLARLKALFAPTQLFLIIGLDEYECLDTWHEPERIIEMAELVVLPRGMRGGTSSKPGIHFPDLPLLEISSSLIRKRIAMGRSIHNWVPPRVETYIRQEKLYKEVL